jgi:hypothetical protein
MTSTLVADQYVAFFYASLELHSVLEKLAKERGRVGQVDAHDVVDGINSIGLYKIKF